MTDNIDFLYHYTNIETLALILSNHTFRFRSLDQMDDLQEKETSDLKNVGQFCFISSWTDDSTESIPMWNMYSSLHSGVRIKLATNPFKKYANTPDSIQAVSKSPVTDNSNGNYIKSIITVADMIAKKYICPGGMSNNIIHKVVYTSNPDELYPKLVSQNEDEYTIAFGSLGKYKNIHWQFQREWRYILQIFPLDIDQNPDQLNTSAQIMITKILQGLEKQPFSYYDLTLDDTAYSNMEITLSPKISPGNRLIVNTLIEKYNPSATVRDSSLLGLI